MNIGKKIIEIRKERNMTQEDFANIFHVTRQTVSNWENEKSYPDLQTLIRISNEFCVSLDTILKEDIRMYDEVENAGFTKEITRDFIAKYQGYYALTENGVDYLVEPKAIGKYQLDTDNFVLTARKGNMDITIYIDEDRKLHLALYPGEIEIDENGNTINLSEKLTDVQREHLNNLLTDRKEELLPIIDRALELWDAING